MKIVTIWCLLFAIHCPHQPKPHHVPKMGCFTDPPAWKVDCYNMSFQAKRRSHW